MVAGIDCLDGVFFLRVLVGRRFPRLFVAYYRGGSSLIVGLSVVLCRKGAVFSVMVAVGGGTVTAFLMGSPYVLSGVVMWCLAGEVWAAFGQSACRSPES